MSIFDPVMKKAKSAKKKYSQYQQGQERKAIAKSNKQMVKERRETARISSKLELEKKRLESRRALEQERAELARVRAERQRLADEERERKLRPYKKAGEAAARGFAKGATELGKGAMRLHKHLTKPAKPTRPTRRVAPKKEKPWSIWDI